MYNLFTWIIGLCIFLLSNDSDIGQINTNKLIMIVAGIVIMLLSGKK